MRRLALAAIAICTAAPALAQQRFVDVQAYHFRINLPDTGRVISGLASVLFNTSPGYDDTLRLDLVGMSVRRVFDIHTLRQLPIAYDGRVLKVVTRQTGTGRPRGVVVEYSGEPQDGLFIGRTVHGRRGIFGDNYPNRARYWLPVIDHPSDKARVLWSVAVPRGWSAVANQPECLPRGRPRRCNESAPMPTYTMVLGATERFTRSVHRPLVSGADTIPIEVWMFPEDSAWADSVPMRQATEYAEALQRIIGPFPFAKLSHVEAATRYSGGMENSTVIFYSERAIAERRLRTSTVRHETAHQWFGDAVTPRDFAHVWLSEGFAVYFGALAGAAVDGDSAFVSALASARERVLGDSLVGIRSVVDTSVRDPNLQLNALTYQKGALVLHMLRHEVGDSAFFRGIREYYRLYRDSSVLSAQFQRVMERMSGEPLAWFFHQWLRQPGYPQLALTWRPAASSVVLTISQAQPEAWGRFRLRNVPVLLVLRDGRVLRRSFPINALSAAQSHTITLNPGDGDVTEIVVDPDAAYLLEVTTTRETR